MEHKRDKLSIWETPNPENTEFSEKQMAKALADALRYYDNPENHTAADVLEEKYGLVIHTRCEAKTALPDLVSLTGGDEWDTHDKTT